eukprot:TRINITY_DN4597_c0_g1_i4.p4 TRINITY_DN4597_c0_g1~~TRINITY_DN4597_c0_g1_i4.p4  ORF type:complete len:119 (-),score=47.98 TRINITY_DN4597_c0_g1_i4:155-511(-)
MAKVPVDQIDQRLRDELCSAYAALILQDDKKEITEESLNKIISASGNKVTSNFVRLFARSCQGQDLDKFLVGGGAPAPATGAPAPTGGAPAKQAAAPVEEPKVEEEEVEMGDLFGDDF